MLNRLPHLVLLASMVTAMLTPAMAFAQSSPVGNLRLVDADGVELQQEPADYGDQIYRVAEGTTALNVAFDFSGNTATDVQVRVMGNMGQILYQESETYDAPGSHVIAYDHETALDIGEYVINVYVGDDVYLADSFQLAVGEEVSFPTSQAGGEGQVIPTPEAMENPQPGPTLETPVDAGEAPGGSPMLLILAGLGMVLLFGVVLWAGWSAMRRS